MIEFMLKYHCSILSYNLYETVNRSHMIMELFFVLVTFELEFRSKAHKLFLIEDVP